MASRIDESANSVLAEKIWNFQTREERPRQISTTICNAHKAATSGSKGQGTSSHKRNLNPDAKVHLTKLHTLTVSFNHSGPRKKVIEKSIKRKGGLSTPHFSHPSLQGGVHATRKQVEPTRTSTISTSEYVASSHRMELTRKCFKST